MALSGMSTMQQVEENLAVAKDPISLSDADKAAIASHLDRLKEMADLYCSGCEYCLPCHNEVRIPHIFQIYNSARVYDLWDRAKAEYAEIGVSQWVKGKKGDGCVECGACEEKCPQHLPIIKQLKEAHAALAE
jgi:uncharacterized protein